MSFPTPQNKKSLQRYKKSPNRQMIREFFSLQFYDSCQFFLSLVLSSKKIRRKDERAEYFGLYSVAQACIDKHEGHVSAR